jgi:hypothetical protein
MEAKRLHRKSCLLYALCLMSIAFFGALFSPQIAFGSPEEESANEAVITTVNQNIVDNEVTLDANTGASVANENTGEGSISSGDSSVILNLETNVNSTAVSLSDEPVNYETTNILGNSTGDILLGERNTENTTSSFPPAFNNLIISNVNDTIVENHINILTNTGENEANLNGGNGTVLTGSANVIVNILNQANVNFIVRGGGYIGIVNVTGDLVGNILLPEGLFTAKDSDNFENECYVCQNPNRLWAFTKNNGIVTNFISISSNTGENSASGNGGNGNITAGDTNEKVAVLNFGNQNVVGSNILLFFINVLGTWNGQNKIDESALILGGENENDCCVGGGENVSLQNNFLSTNDVQISTNTGRNSAIGNGGDGIIQTGNSNVLVNVLNFYNLNISADKLFLVIVNVLGDWTGDIDYGRGGGQEEPFIIDEPDETLVYIAGVSDQEIVQPSGSLPNAGAQNIVYLFGLPLLGLFIIRMVELKAHKDIA